MPGIDPLRIEEAGLNALQTQRQLFYDGWLLRVSPGKAKRARSVNAHFGSTLPIDAKIDHCERVYGAHRLPALFRITPFVNPAELDEVLERRGYVVYQPTCVQLRAIDGTPQVRAAAALVLDAPAVDEFVREVAALRGSTAVERAAHLERLGSTPLATRCVVARENGRTIACGQVALDRDLAGIYDMVTDPDFRGRGIATRIVAELLSWARRNGASHAFLQVDADNAPALAVYRKFGFATAYAYHYRARPGECR